MDKLKAFEFAIFILDEALKRSFTAAETAEILATMVHAWFLKINTQECKHSGSR